MKAVHKLGIAAGLLAMGLLTSASSCSKFAIDSDHDYRYTETIQQSINFAGKAELILDNFVGAITVEDGPEDLIELAATKKAESRADLEKVRLEIQENPTSVEIHSMHPEHQRAKWAVEYVLKVPAGSRLTIDQGAGEIRITNHEGSMSIDLGVGEVKLENILAEDLHPGFSGKQLLP